MESGCEVSRPYRPRVGESTMARKKASEDRERLRELIEEATADCYGGEEEHQGLVGMIEDNVVCPFAAKVIGETVEVTALEAPPAGLGLNAVCRYKDKEYRIDVASLEWPEQRPEGFEWVETYLEWRNSIG
jgi:hypothetical protein